MNICCLNISYKMCVYLLPLALSGATATLEPYPRIHRLVLSLSPRIAAERKNHLAIARPYKEVNTVGFGLSRTYKKICSAANRVQRVQIVMCKL